MTIKFIHFFSQEINLHGHSFVIFVGRLVNKENRQPCEVGVNKFIFSLENKRLLHYLQISGDKQFVCGDLKVTVLTKL